MKQKVAIEKGNTTYDNLAKGNTSYDISPLKKFEVIPFQVRQSWKTCGADWAR